MSKKPRPKKKYRPRAVAVPTYINSLSSDVDHGKDAREEDRVFLLQVANRTVEKVDLAMYGRIMQIALMKIQGYSTREIAVYLDITEKAVYRRMDRLKEKLKKFFE